MIGRIETTLRRIGRKFSRTHWLMRFLHLSVSEGSPNRPGLIMLQVDGLSLHQFNRAIENGELPFLKRLIKREFYQVHTLYSGLPSSTPGVQAEIFYGVKTAVPAFSFLDREKGHIVRMYEPAAAMVVEKQIEEELKKENSEPLCKGGSSYANIFTAGVDIDEAHFCASSLGWGSALRAANPFALLFLILANLNSVVRIVVLLVFELLVAVVDFFRGLYDGRSLFKELKFIPTRVAICILLRELCVIGGKMDIARGLPVIHINFLGYDEQSHRRGPSSKFAHWTLKGIDNAIERLWNAASHAPRRHYEVWIYSDHGQSKTTSYFKAQGYDILEAVTAVLAGLDPAAPPEVSKKVSTSVETQRARFLGAKKSGHLFSVQDMDRTAGDSDKIQVAGLGPVGFVYYDGKLGDEELELAARNLVSSHKVPVVVTGRESGQLRAWTEDGEFLLPQQTAELFGEDHPFIDVIGEDLVTLCRHQHAGDLTLLGWRKGVTPITFANENGSHAGLTHEETRAFSLLPKDAPLPESTRSYLRPAEIREAALRYLGRSKSVSAAPGASSSPMIRVRRKRSSTAQTEQLRIMTYNVHSCVGIDGKFAAERIARVIARANPDVVALQELDVGRLRTGGEDQAELIARYLKMEYHFNPNIHIEEEQYGDAILTHLPMKVIKAGALPGHVPGGRVEPRGALWVAVDLHGTQVHIVNTHLGLTSSERLLQINQLLGKNWLGSLEKDEPVILCGDFNAVPSSRVYRQMRSRFLDAQAQLENHRPKCTFFSRLPSVRIDHIFIDPGIKVAGITVPRSELATIASDHLPLIADLLIPCTGGGALPEEALPLGDDPDRVDDAGNIPEQRQQDVEPEGATYPDLEEDTERR